MQHSQTAKSMRHSIIAKSILEKQKNITDVNDECPEQSSGYKDIYTNNTDVIRVFGLEMTDAIQNIEEEEVCERQIIFRYNASEECYGLSCEAYTTDETYHLLSEELKSYDFVIKVLEYLVSRGSRVYNVNNEDLYTSKDGILNSIKNRILEEHIKYITSTFR